MVFGGACFEVLRAVLWESRAGKLCTCQSGRNLCSRYLNKYLRLANEKFVLASESNLSLAAGLASWKVILEPWYSFFGRSGTVILIKLNLYRWHEGESTCFPLMWPGFDSGPVPYVGWVCCCCMFTLLWRVFLWTLQFSSLYRYHIPIISIWPG